MPWSIPPTSSANAAQTRAALGANGDLAILYREKTDNRRDMYLVLIKKDGSHTRTRVSQIPWEINACPMTYWDFRPAGDGYIAVWPTRGTLYFNRISADGKPVSAVEIKTDGRTAMRSQPLALTNEKGEVLIAWREQKSLQWQVYDAQNRTPRLSKPPPPAPARRQRVSSTDQGRFVLFP